MIERSHRNVVRVLEEEYLDEKYGGNILNFLYSIYGLILDRYEEKQSNLTPGEMFSDEIKELYPVITFLDSLYGFIPISDWKINKDDILLLKFLCKNNYQFFISGTAGVLSADLLSDGFVEKGGRAKRFEFIRLFLNSVLNTSLNIGDLDKGKSFIDGRPDKTKRL